MEEEMSELEIGDKAKKGKKGKKDAAEDEGALDKGTHELAVVTANLTSRKDSRDIKIDSFSISLFGARRPTCRSGPPCACRRVPEGVRRQAAV